MGQGGKLQHRRQSLLVEALSQHTKWATLAQLSSGLVGLVVGGRRGFASGAVVAVGDGGGGVVVRQIVHKSVVVLLNCALLRSLNLVPFSHRALTVRQSVVVARIVVVARMVVVVAVGSVVVGCRQFAHCPRSLPVGGRWHGRAGRHLLSHLVVVVSDGRQVAVAHARAQRQSTQRARIKLRRAPQIVAISSDNGGRAAASGSGTGSGVRAAANRVSVSVGGTVIKDAILLCCVLF